MNNDAPFGYDDDGKPKAPYGYTAKGQIKKDSRGRPSTRRGAGRGPAAPKPRTGPPTGGTRRKQDYTKTLESLLHMALAPLSLAPATALDAAVFLDHSKNLATAGNEVVQHYPVAAEWCQKMMKGGPVALLVGALLPPFMQVAENHQWLPPHVTSKFGAVPAAQYAEQLARRMQAAQHAAAPQVPEQHVNGYAHAGAGV